MRAVVGAIVLLATACTFEPASGQFGCADGRCPEGFACVAARCVRPSDAETPDAGTDAEASAEDSGVDGGALDAGPPPPCPTDFCADFDEGSVLSGWSVAEVVGTGQIEAREDLTAPSPTRVFASTVSLPPPDAPYHAARLSLQEGIPGYDADTPQLSLAFAFRVDEFVDNPGVTLADLRYGADEHYVVVAINPDPTDATRVELNYYFAPEAVVHPIGVVAIGAWVDLEIVVPRRTGTPGTPVGGGVTFVVDGVPTTGLLPAAALTDALRFDVGLSTTGPDARLASVVFDAVRIGY